MEMTVFCDESGTTKGMDFYTIGALAIPTKRIERFSAYFEALKLKHGVVGEPKWNKISTSHGQLNFSIDLFKSIIKANCQMAFIVVNKSLYNKWREDEESAFYTTYTMLVHTMLRLSQGSYSVYMDGRNDTYRKQNEVLHIITQNMLRQISSQANIAKVEKKDSKMLHGIQAIDIFTGAVNCSHQIYFNPSWGCQFGKKLLISRLGGILGWSSLHFDTYPKPFPNPNIWHFPNEGFRGVPESKNVHFNPSIRYVAPIELRAG